MLLLVEGGFIFCTGQVMDLIVGIYLTDTSQFTFWVGFALQALDNIFWSTMPMYLPVVILLVENNRTIADSYFGFDSDLLADAADVEAASHQEGGPISPTIDHPGTAQASAHEGNDNH